MNIKNYASAVNAYRYTADSLNRSPSAKKSVKSGSNVDKADFSAGARAAALKSSDSASSERISALRFAISNGSYNVSADEVASAILGII